MKINEICEAGIGRSAPLYHATNLENIPRILKSNSLEAHTTHAAQYFDPRLRGTAEADKKISGVSLTRDKNFADEWSDVILILDQEKIRHTNKLIPINYFNDDGDTYSAQDREEREEFVLGSIKNLDKCLIGIYFPKRIESDYTNWKWVQKNIMPVKNEFIGWKHVVENPKYIGKAVTGTQQKKAVGESIETNNFKIKKEKFDNYSIYMGKKKIGEAVLYKDTYGDDKAINIGYFGLLHEFRNLGYGLKCLQVIKDSVSKIVPGAQYVIVEPMSKVMFNLNIKVFGQPLYCADDISEYTPEEALNILPTTVPEDKEGQLSGGRRFFTVFNLKKNVNERILDKENGILWSKDGYSIKSVKDNNNIDLFLAYNDKQIGHLVSTVDTKDNYLEIIAIYVEPKFQKRGFGKLFYSLLLKHMDSSINGIKSDLSSRANKNEIPSIYKSFGSYEKDGYAYIDKKNINESANLYQASSYLVALTPRNFRLNKRSVKNVLWDLTHGKFSRTKAPIKVFGSEYGQWQVADGYHRIIQAILLGKRKIKIVKIPPQQSFIYAETHDHDLWNWDINALLDKQELYDLVTKLKKDQEENRTLYESQEVDLTYEDILQRFPAPIIKTDLRDAAGWLATTPENLTYKMVTEPVLKFKDQILEMLDSYDEFPQDKARTDKIISLLKHVEDQLPIFIDADPAEQNFIVEGRHRIVAFYLMKFSKVSVIYFTKKKIKESIINEHGRIIPGANTPVGITVDHTKLMAARLGFNVSRDGRPPIMPTNGKINNTPQTDPDHSADDKKSMFTGAALTRLTNYKGKDIAE